MHITCKFLILVQDGNNYLSSNDANNASVHQGLGVPVDGRPKSCCDVSRVPGIKYYLLNPNFPLKKYFKILFD